MVGKTEKGNVRSRALDALNPFRVGEPLLSAHRLSPLQNKVTGGYELSREARDIVLSGGVVCMGNKIMTGRPIGKGVCIESWGLQHVAEELLGLQEPGKSDVEMSAVER